MKRFLLFVLLLSVLTGCEKQDNPGSDPTPTPTPIPIGENCKASAYQQVTIGTQTWMAENYKCSIYDTESEAYKEGRYTIPMLSTLSYVPYYVDATDTSKWCSVVDADILSDVQITKLGYLYNWSAAVGVAEGDKQMVEFTGNRQGICPNGWHIPSRAEWQTLAYYIEVAQGKGSESAGKHLKSKTGWSQREESKNGEDTYGFVALPAGLLYDMQGIINSGYRAEFWTNLSNEYRSYSASNMSIDYNQDALNENRDTNKGHCSSVRCLKNSNVEVSPKIKQVNESGEEFNVNIKSNTSWSVSVNKDWVFVTPSDGSGSDNISVTVARMDESEEYGKYDTAYVTVKNDAGEFDVVRIYRRKLYPEKCNASEYLQVTIGEQTWMAENYRCSRYDTESEAYNASWLTDNTISESVLPIMANEPYYTDASNKINWKSKRYSENLTEVHIAKLGYLYNWAAAVGIDDGEKQTTQFKNNRQGICPNGWHIPTQAEWQNLIKYIEVEQNKGKYMAGKHLKSTSGWYSDSEYYEPGIDTYGFAALPADDSEGSSICFVGYTADFWTSTPDNNENYFAYAKYINYGGTSMSDYYMNYKGYGLSVRCLRD